MYPETSEEGTWLEKYSCAEAFEQTRYCCFDKGNRCHTICVEWVIEFGRTVQNGIEL